MTTSPALQGVRKAARQRERADSQHRQATADLRAWIAQARTDGVSITQIAR